MQKKIRWHCTFHSSYYLRKMQIYFSYQKKQVLQALRYHFISRPEIKVLLIVVNVFAIAAAILLSMHKVSPLAFLLSSILWLSLMAAFWVVLPRMVYRKSSTFKEKFSMIFSNSEVRLENERGYNEWTWNQFSSYLESPLFIHLYFNSSSFFLVPKEAIESFGDMANLRKLLEEKIKK